MHYKSNRGSSFLEKKPGKKKVAKEQLRIRIPIRKKNSVHFWTTTQKSKVFIQQPFVRNLLLSAEQNICPPMLFVPLYTKSVFINLLWIHVIPETLPLSKKGLQSWHPPTPKGRQTQSKKPLLDRGPEASRTEFRMWNLRNTRPALIQASNKVTLQEEDNRRLTENHRKQQRRRTDTYT